MHLIRIVGLILLLFGAAGCSQQVRPYTGPEVTHVYIKKDQRRLYLIHNDRVLDSFKVELGFAPDGHKQFEGDGRTPEGTYMIDRRNPKSSFYLSLGISYPNERDVAFARAAGKSPGGDIFIHGRPNGQPRKNDPDWTAGCISVSNKAIAKIYTMVRNGTPVTIHP